MKRRLLPAALTLALLSACAHAGAPTASSVAPGENRVAAASADENLKVNPDAARERAAKKAHEWAGDARLVGEGWALAKFELTSVVYHVFQSNRQGKLLIVQSKLVSFWQDTREITDKRLTLPARLLDTLDETYISSAQAVDVAKQFLPEGSDHPVALLALWKPNRFMPALYAVKADAIAVLVNAKSGKALAHADADVPVWPFGDLSKSFAATP